MPRTSVMRLTDEERALARQVRDEWFHHGTSTMPADRVIAEAAIDRAYELAFEKPPQFKIWADGPLTASKLANEFRRVSDGHRKVVRSRVGLFNKFVDELVVSDRIAWSMSAIGASLGQIGERIGKVVRAELEYRFVKVLRQSSNHQISFGSSQFGVKTLAKIDFLGRIGVDVSPVEPILTLAKTCGYWFATPQVAILCERPTALALKDFELAEWLGQMGTYVFELHSETGPAIAWPDGFGVYVIDGVRVPERTIADPRSITMADILNEGDVRVRRLMLARADLAQLARSHYAERLQRDETGILFALKLKDDDEPFIGVLMRDHASGQEHAVRVPPTIRTARQGVAWSFGLEDATYRLQALA